MASTLDPSTARVRRWLSGRRSAALDLWPPLLVLLYTGAVLALVLLRAPASVRTVPVLVYLALVPGLACARLLRLPDHLMTLLLGVGLSLALGTIVALAMVYLRQWSPTLGMTALATVAAVAAVIELALHRLGASPGRSPRGAL